MRNNDNITRVRDIIKLKYIQYIEDINLYHNYKELQNFKKFKMNKEQSILTRMPKDLRHLMIDFIGPKSYPRIIVLTQFLPSEYHQTYGFEYYIELYGDSFLVQMSERSFAPDSSVLMQRKKSDKFRPLVFDTMDTLVKFLHHESQDPDELALVDMYPIDDDHPEDGLSFEIGFLENYTSTDYVYRDDIVLSHPGYKASLHIWQIMLGDKIGFFTDMIGKMAIIPTKNDLEI